MEDHVHNFPKSGVGCYCGAKQCAHVDTIVKPGYRPTKKRCKSEVVPGTELCREHHAGFLKDTTR